LKITQPPNNTLFPYTTLFRSDREKICRRSKNKNRQIREGQAAFHLNFPNSAPAGELFPEFSHFLSIHDNESARAKDIRINKFRRSEEHTSELQSRSDLVCRLL